MKIFKIFFLLIMISLTSCTNNKNVNKEYVETIYIDYENDLYTLHLFTAPISDYGKNDSNTSANVLSTKGSSIIEAIKLLNNKLENTLDFHHTQSLIIGKNLYENKSKLQTLFETFYKYNEISRKGNLYTTQEDFTTLEEILKKDLTLKKLTFPISISDCLYSLNNYGYFVINSLEKDDDAIISEKGNVFINYDYICTTDKDYSLGYFLLTGTDQEDLVLDSNYIVKNYSVKDNIIVNEYVIYYDVYIKIDGKYASLDYDKSKTVQYVYDKVNKSYNYFRDISFLFFDIDNKIYKNNYAIYEDYIENKDLYTITPRFFIDVED